MPTYDYSTLVSDVQTWMENTDTSFVAQVPTFIANGETRLYRDLIIPQLEYEATGTLTVNNGFFTRPNDLIALRYMSLQSNNNQNPILILIQYAFGITMYPGLTDIGQPLYYSVYDSTRYRLFPIPDANYPYNFFYRRRLPALSNTNQTNWLTDNAYDLLLASALCEASRFVLDDRQASLIQINEAKYQSALKAINFRETKASVDDYQIPFSVEVQS
jgi:hypothetical protein